MAVEDAQAASRLAAWIENAPGQALATFLALHVALWALIPALFQPNLPLDVVEQLAWGREWQWAYFKHPPLPAWTVEIVALLTHGWDRALFFVGPLASALALYLIWRLATDIVGQRLALVAVLVQEGVLYFTFFTPEFNHNVIQVPLWALIGWTARRSLIFGRIRDWIILGLAAGLGMLGKYSTGLLLLALAIFVLAEPGARRCLKTPGPWLALAAMLLLLAPHIVVLGTVHYGPLDFPFERGTWAAHWPDHIVFPLQFAGAQVLNLLPALLLLGVLLTSGQPDAKELQRISAFDRHLAALLCFGPFLISVAASAFLGLRFKDMWGAPFWDYVGLFAVVCLGREAPRPSERFLGLWAAIFLLGPIAYAAQFPGQALLHAKPLRGQFPGAELAAAVEAGWHRSQGGRALRYVAGGVWYAGNIAFALWPERPSVLIDGERSKSPWVNGSDLACHGLVVVWQGAGERDALLSRFPDAQQQPDIQLSYRTWNSQPSVRLGWAIVPPTATCDVARS
ncbi:MAG: glycosyltransferase family 39 protein [Methylobacteriaceae bacterium]|nr:glycosyltransferase family 39 protein [Methylobacteriaceae bacterium]